MSERIVFDPSTGEAKDGPAGQIPESDPRHGDIAYAVGVIREARAARFAAEGRELEAQAALAKLMVDGEEARGEGWSARKHPPKRVGKRGVDHGAIDTHVEALPPALQPRHELVSRTVKKYPTLKDVEAHAGTLAQAGLAPSDFIIEPGWAPAEVEVLTG